MMIENDEAISRLGSVVGYTTTLILCCAPLYRLVSIYSMYMKLENE